MFSRTWIVISQWPSPRLPLLRTSAAAMLLLTAGGCTQETFTPAAEEQVLLLAEPEQKIEILKQPLKPETVTWDGRIIDGLEVEGTLRVEYDDSLYFFIQLKCPAALKCNGSKAYVPASLVYQFEDISGPTDRYEIQQLAQAEQDEETPAFTTVRPFHLFTRKNLAAAEKTREWLRDPGSELPELSAQWSSDAAMRMIDAYLNDRADDLERERRIAEWYYLSVSHKESLRNDAFVPYLRNYAAYPGIVKIAAGASSEDIGFSPDQLEFLSALHDYSARGFHEQAKNMGHDFPFQARNFGDLAKIFNTRLTLPLYRAMIFKQILDDVAYEAVSNVDAASTIPVPGGEAPTDAALATADTAARTAGETSTPVVNVLFDLEFGAVVKYKTASGSTEERIFPGIRAEPHENGLAFELSTAEGEILRVRPMKLSSFLAAANPGELKKYRIMAHDEIMQAGSYRRRAMLTALKYGVGDYDRSARRFRFELKMDDAKVYWKVLALFKSSPAIDVFESDVYKGTLNAEYGEGGEIRWYQTYDRESKYSSLKVAGQYEECGRECFTESVDQVCFDNTAASRVVIEFPGKSIGMERPEDVEIAVRMPEEAYYYAMHICGSALGAELEASN